jgi:hypothetical protein
VKYEVWLDQFAFNRGVGLWITRVNDDFHGEVALPVELNFVPRPPGVMPAPTLTLIDSTRDSRQLLESFAQELQKLGFLPQVKGATDKAEAIAAHLETAKLEGSRFHALTEKLVEALIADKI